MVDALRECWRVLEPNGWLLDLRPIASTVPIERVCTEGTTPIGELDGSVGIAADRASDAALREMLAERRFVRERLLSFEVALVFADKQKLLARLATPTHRRGGLTPEEIRRLAARCEGPAQLQTRERMSLGVYRRCALE